MGTKISTGAKLNEVIAQIMDVFEKYRIDQYEAVWLCELIKRTIMEEWKALTEETSKEEEGRK